MAAAFSIDAVSYTHLDVYKRQERYSAIHKGKADKLAGSCRENATGETAQASAEWKYGRNKKKGSPRRRWIHGVEED